MLVLNGTREGLFLGALAAKRYVGGRTGHPAILIPNPFYAAYSAGALAADCEPVYLPATREHGFLPDLEALDEALLKRTVAFYLASPSNPQGAVASRDYLDRLAALSRRFGFMVFADECYGEIYSKDKPAGMLEAAGSRLHQHGCVSFAVEAVEPARPACRLCRRRQEFPRCLSRTAQRRGPASAGPDAACRCRRLQ